jgi:uncharacterized protein (DUF302 family)
MLPAEVLVFGNALSGTPLMRSTPTIGIELPTRALAWQDESGATWLAFNDPAWLARRHSSPAAFHADVEVIAAGLIAVGRTAVPMDQSVA